VKCLDQRSQMIKGFLEGFILAVIEREQLYSAQIIQKLSEHGMKDLSEGTLYPLMLRLEQQHMVIGIRVSNPLGPMRKIYQITELGKTELQRIIKDWEAFQLICQDLFNRGVS
jgi:PadR family transcriptional regulator, regulatory protein PadR